MHVDFYLKMSVVQHIKVIIKNYDENNLSSSTALFLQEHAIGLENIENHNVVVSEYLEISPTQPETTP